MWKYFLALAVGLACFATAHAQPAERQPSTCMAIAMDIPASDFPVRFVRFSGPVREVSDNRQYTVRISYQGHSTYLIESPSGVKIATDYAGWMVDPVTPDIVTMNHAHSSHYTLFPDARIRHVFKGWPQDGKAAEYHDLIDDVLVRNVTTDIVRFAREKDGNSIFIFELAGLCIGHLGHLHHKLNEEYYARIGRLDVVMVPIDGGLTMTHVSAKEIIERLRSSIVLPMHVRSYDAMPRFLNHLGSDSPVRRLKSNELLVSLKNLPKQPAVFILPGVDTFQPPEE